MTTIPAGTEFRDERGALLATTLNDVDVHFPAQARDWRMANGEHPTPSTMADDALVRSVQRWLRAAATA